MLISELISVLKNIQTVNPNTTFDAKSTQLITEAVCADVGISKEQFNQFSSKVKRKSKRIINKSINYKGLADTSASRRLRKRRRNEANLLVNSTEKKHEASSASQEINEVEANFNSMLISTDAIDVEEIPFLEIEMAGKLVHLISTSRTTINDKNALEIELSTNLRRKWRLIIRINGLIFTMFEQNRKSFFRNDQNNLQSIRMSIPKFALQVQPSEWIEYLHDNFETPPIAETETYMKHLLHQKGFEFGEIEKSCKITDHIACGDTEFYASLTFSSAVKIVEAIRSYYGQDDSIKTFVDLGHGIGLVCFYIAAMGFRVFGIECCRDRYVMSLQNLDKILAMEDYHIQFEHGEIKDLTCDADVHVVFSFDTAFELNSRMQIVQYFDNSNADLAIVINDKTVKEILNMSNTEVVDSFSVSFRGGNGTRKCTIIKRIVPKAKSKGVIPKMSRRIVKDLLKSMP